MSRDRCLAPVPFVCLDCGESRTGRCALHAHAPFAKATRPTACGTCGQPIGPAGTCGCVKAPEHA